jgi:hypothetical protein
MNQGQEKKSEDKELLDKIKKGEVKRRPKSYFVIRSFLYALIILAILGFSLFLGSFIFFSMRATGIFFLPILGFPGLKLFLLSFPWILIVFIVLLIVLAEALLKKLHVIYSRPLLYSAIVLVVLVFFGSFVMERTRIHAGLFERAREDMLPIMGPVYKGFGNRQIRNTCIGEVTAVLTDGLIVETVDGREVKVVTSEGTNCPCGLEQIDTGDMVIIMGEEKDGEISALGVNKIAEEENPYWHRPPKVFPNGQGPGSYRGPSMMELSNRL